MTIETKVAVFCSIIMIIYYSLGFYAGRQWEIQKRQFQCATQKQAFRQLDQDLSDIQRLLDEEHARQQYDVEMSHGTAP